MADNHGGLTGSPPTFKTTPEGDIIPEPLEDYYRKVHALKNNTTMARIYLTEDVIKKYKGVKTSLGSELGHCLTANAYHTSINAPKAADDECYDVFSDYFDGVIRDYHNVKTEKIIHPKPDFGDLNNLPFGNLDPTGEFVVSTRVRIGRSVKGLKFIPRITKEERIKLEEMVLKVLSTVSGEHKGKYYSMGSLSEKELNQMIEDHLMFCGDLASSRDYGCYRHWPVGRGAYINDSKSFLVWINEEDHLRIMSLQKGGNLAEVYRRLVKGVQILGEKIDFVHHDQLGFLLCCPSNLGTTMRASVHVKIPLLSDLPNFKGICRNLSMQVRGTGGEQTEGSSGGVYDISNLRRLGKTEIDCAAGMAAGVIEVIKIEKELMKNNPPNILELGLMPVEPLSMLAAAMKANAACNSLVKKHLTDAIVQKYKDTKTKLGSTLSHCIRSAAYNAKLDLPLMGDAECYDLFADYVGPILKEYYGSDAAQPAVNFGDVSKLPFSDVDPSGKFVLAIQASVSRSVNGHNFHPTMTKDRRVQLEKKIADVLKCLSGESAGKYMPVKDMNQGALQPFIDDGLVCPSDNPMLRDAGAYRDLPDGRGIFSNNNRTFVALVGKEEHLKLTSTQKNGKLGEVYKRLATGVNAIGSKLDFSRHARYGFLNFCSGNIGSGLQISVKMKVPKLAANSKRCQELCDQLKLTACGVGGCGSECKDGICVYTNNGRLGSTEIDVATQMAKAVEAIIAAESKL